MSNLKNKSFVQVAQYFKRNFDNCPYYVYDRLTRSFHCVGSSPCRITNTCLTPKMYVCKPRRKRYVKPYIFVEFSLWQSKF